MNLKSVLALSSTAGSAETHKSISFIWIVCSTLYVYLLFAYLLSLLEVLFDNFSSKTPLNTGLLCSGSDPIDILRGGVKVDDDEDLESGDLIIQLDFSAIQKVKNQSKDEKNDPLISFEHFTLLHKKSREILIQPLVEAYLNLKWQSLKKWWFGYRLLFFLAFGVCLTLLISFIVEMNSNCEYEAKIEIKNETELSNKTIKGKLLK